MRGPVASLVCLLLALPHHSLADSRWLSLQATDSDSKRRGGDDVYNADYSEQSYDVRYRVTTTEHRTVTLLALSGDLDVTSKDDIRALSADSLTLGLILDHKWDRLQFRTAFSHARSEYDATRTVRTPSGSTRFTGRYDGHESTIYVELGLELGQGVVSAVPYINWLGDRYEQDGYTESSSGGGSGETQKPLKRDGSRVGVGIRFRQDLPMSGSGRFTFYQSFLYTQQNVADAAWGSMKLYQPLAGNSFVLLRQGENQPDVDRNIVQYQFGAEFAHSDHFYLRFGYLGITNDDLDVDLLNLSMHWRLK